MTEIDRVWSEMLGAAGQRAAAAGDHHLADYLRLKATNDAIRARGVAWLFESLIALAAEAQRTRHGVVIEREDPHAFRRGNSNMVGSALFVRQGVRCLTLEAGWARTPSDGIMHKGALAYARLTHFGMPRSGTETKLIFDDKLPTWQSENCEVVDSEFLARHIAIWLG